MQVDVCEGLEELVQLLANSGMSRRAVGPPPSARHTIPCGVNPNVWGMDAISSSCVLILRTLFIANHLLSRKRSFSRRSNR